MSSATRLLVRVDDAGASRASNVGCLRAVTEGIARSIEVMMPCQWVDHAAEILTPHTSIDIGIHLTLTSEWDDVKWRPLTDAPGLVDAEGNFLPCLFDRPGGHGPSLEARGWDASEIAQELSAQMELGRRMFPTASHVSCHMARHFRDLDPVFGEIIASLCAKFGLADDAFGSGLPRFRGYPPLPRDPGARISAFKTGIETLDPGTHIFIDHPAAPDDELQKLGHTGYRDVAADRLSCLDVLTDAGLAAAIAARGIALISYPEL